MMSYDKFPLIQIIPSAEVEGSSQSEDKEEVC
jgi:hypothetical protein